MTRFRVPAASLLTLLLVAANLVAQTYYGPGGNRQTRNEELEVQQLPLGTSVTCASFQPVAAANYLLSWTGLWQQGRYCEAEAAAKQACDNCPANLAAKHALVVSQLVNALQCETTKCEGEKRTIRITGEIKCGNLGEALEACCKPLLKLVCTPSATGSSCAACPAKCCLEATACCADLTKTASAPAATKTSCACGDKCACAKKACACGADCACKESDKKAQRRAARRALPAPLFVLPPNLDGDLPLPTRPVPMLMPMGPMPRPGMRIMCPPVHFGGGINSEEGLVGSIVLSNPGCPLLPAGHFGVVPPPPAVCPMPCREKVLEDDFTLLQASRFEYQRSTRPTPRVRFEMAGLEVQCDRLSRLKDGRFVCEGDVCMTLRRENHPSKILAERIVVSPDGCFEVGTRCEIDKP